jgi:Sulfotransferase family
MRPPAPFVVGASRSGTTMLRLMLDSHPQLAIPPETHFIPEVAALCKAAEDPAAVGLEAILKADRWPSFQLDPGALRRRAMMAQCRSLSDVLRVFYGSYAEAAGKPRWGDKTPFYLVAMPLISRLLDEAHFVHIIRDGRDVALSVIPLWYGPASVPEAAEWWVKRVRRAREDGAHLPYAEVHYEKLVVEPEAELRRLCPLLELDYDAAMLSFDKRVRERTVRVGPHLVNLSVAAAVADEPGKPEASPETTVRPRDMQARLSVRLSGPPDTASVGRWRTEMTSADVRSFNAIAGDLLEELGYPLQ